MVQVQRRGQSHPFGAGSGRVRVHYQPKVNMRSGKVIGAEALIRWQHPDKGLLAPAAFLPLIEDHPLAIEESPSKPCFN